MTVADVMTAGVETVPPGMHAPDAWDVMRRKRIHHLVVTIGSKVVGVISDSDGDGPGGVVLRADSEVSDLMATHVATNGPREPVRRAAQLMADRAIGCLPVVSGKRLVGIVTTTDLVALVARVGCDLRGTLRPRRGRRHRARKSKGARTP